MIYVASSWRNPIHIAVCAALKAADLEHYDFKNPQEGEHGFHWSEVMPGYVSGSNVADPEDYLRALEADRAVQGFGLDFAAMQKCDTCVLVLPCGRSAHLELGWFVGQGKRTAILLDDPVTPELMYKMVDYIAPSMFDLLGWLGVEG